MGAYSTSQFMGAFLGGSLGGLLLEHAGITGVLALMAVILCCWLGVALTMPAPSHTSSFVVQLRNAARSDAREVDQTLRELPGVEDVVILEGADTAYLKVDRKLFDEERLSDFPFVQPASAT